MTSVQDDTAMAKDLADAAAAVMGSVDGHRVTHTKGVVLAGTFTATPRARELTRAVHMQGDAIPVTVRFSNGAGQPTCPDAALGDPRGMAVKFTLPGGTRTDLVCQSWPLFPAGTPEGFRDLLLAQADGEEATERFLAENPQSAAALEAIATVAEPPLAWSRMAFNSLVAFRLVAADGTARHVRFRLEPTLGSADLPADGRDGAHNDYLMTGVLDEVPVRHRLLAQVAEDGDPLTDCSLPWPAEREWVDLGLVELTGPDMVRERDGDILVFDPTRLTDGIEPTDDPILHIRHHVYAESVRRRTGG